VRRLLPIPLAAACLALSACGTHGIQVSQDDPTYRGAVVFSERCSGCHTLSAAGAQGSANRRLRNQGPNFDNRKVTYDAALFAIRNGGYSGAIMPQNIVTGRDADEVAKFLAKWSNPDATGPTGPAPNANLNQP
jgi:mono/diheme cytochrome c family protein